MAVFDHVDFAKATDDALSHIGRLDAEGLQHASGILADAQTELLRKLANAPTEYGSWFYNALLTDAKRLSQEIDHDLRQRIETGLEAVIDIGDQTVTQAIRYEAEHVGLSLYMPAISRQSIELLTGYVPGEKISGVAGSLQQKLSGMIQQALLGGTSPWDLQKQIGATLTDAGPFKSTLHRAEVIWRTESLRFFNALAQERYKKLEDLLPDEFEKVWSHSGNTRRPRPHHVALNGQAIGVNERFLVGGYEALYPHDPILPAKETVNCGCSHYVQSKR